MFAAQSGYMLDAMDVLLYVFAVTKLKQEFGMDNAHAGFVSSVTLICSAVGGIVCGVLADRLGRTRTLVYTMLLYSLASGGKRHVGRLLQSDVLARTPLDFGSGG